MAFETFSADEVSNAISDAKSVAFFATWCNDARIREAEVRYIQELAVVHDQVVVITNSRVIKNRDVFSTLRVSFLFTTQNAARDFGLWFKALKVFDVRKLQRLTLVNDSCVCIKSLVPVFSSMQGTEVWGVTNSFEVAEHLQSYLVCISSRRALSSFYDWVESIDMNKYVHCSVETVVNTFEIGMSRFLSSRGHFLRPVYDVKLLDTFNTQLCNRRHGNASWHYWDRMLVMGCPLVKKRRAHYSNEEQFIEQFAKEATIKSDSKTAVDCLILVSVHFTSGEKRVKALRPLTKETVRNALRSFHESYPVILHDGDTSLLEHHILQALECIDNEKIVKYSSDDIYAATCWVGTVKQVLGIERLEDTWKATFA